MAVSEVVEGVVEEHETVLSGADVPRVLYQCADCELLFDALSLWQQHRKMGCCQETGPGPGEEQAEATESMLEPPEQSESENTDHREQEEAEGGGEYMSGKYELQFTSQCFSPSRSHSSNNTMPQKIDTRPCCSSLFNLLHGQGPTGVITHFYNLRIAQPVCIKVPVITE